MWKKAWEDTIPAIGYRNRGNAIRSIILVVIALFIVRYLGGQLQMSEELWWIVASAIAVGIVFVGTFLFNLIRAPVYLKWEEEKKPKISVATRSGKRDHEWQHQHLMWAELEVTNTSINQELKDVEVQVTEVISLIPRQDEPQKYLLYPIQHLSPTVVCWSERFAPPNQLRLSIPPNQTRSALVAFCDDSNGMWTIFNSPITIKPRNLDGARVQIEVSSPSSAPYKGFFYIQCHPNYTDGRRAIFEFVEWDDWVSSHDVTIHQSSA